MVKRAASCTGNMMHETLGKLNPLCRIGFLNLPTIQNLTKVNTSSPRSLYIHQRILPTWQVLIGYLL
uniref:Uncharacterized protein n=1 Tax=Populus trichocarpa TaxID=3694 RepID=A0A2K1XN31_POPTR